MHKRSSWHRQIRTHAYMRHIHHTKLVTAMSCFAARGHDKNEVCSHFQNSPMSITVVEKY